MALGYHRRIHLPIPVLLYLAVQSQAKDRRRSGTPRYGERGGDQWRLTDLELLLCAQRAVLARAEESG